MIEVVGGTYSEECSEPPSMVLIGSGLRAAAMIAAAGHDVRFTTAISPSERPEVEQLAAAFGFGLVLETRTDPVRFQYDTPISPPRLRHVPTSTRLVVEGENVLVFGMVDAQVAATGQRMVWDPQQPTGERVVLPEAFRADELVVVANDDEIRRLGGHADPAEAARQVLADDRVVAVLVKMGALGALVVTRHTTDLEPPVPTATVWPIGSGDAFAAGFAAGWMGEGHDVRTAVGRAMQFASSWCATRDLTSIVSAGALPGSSTEARRRSARVYLAGPFFDLGQRWLVNTARRGLQDVSPELDVFSPLHDVGPGEIEVAAQDLAGLEASDALLALGDGDDPGTIFEIGWARARNIPVVVYGQRLNHEGLKMVLGTGCETCEDLSTAVYRAAWHAHGILPHP